MQCCQPRKSSSRGKSATLVRNVTGLFVTEHCRPSNCQTVVQVQDLEWGPDNKSQVYHWHRSLAPYHPFTSSLCLPCLRPSASESSSAEWSAGHSQALRMPKSLGSSRGSGQR